MAQTINTNLMSLNAQRNLNATQTTLANSIQRLSSGLRVNSAKDDAAGLAIAERMNSQVRGMNVAIRNANDGISLGQVAESALGKIGDMMQRMRELAVQSANATNGSNDRAALNGEFGQLQQEITRTLGSTKFNGLAVLQTSNVLKFQIGPGTDASVDQVSISGVDLSADANVSTMVDTTATDVTTDVNALKALTNIDAAMAAVTTTRAGFGAVQNRFEAVISTLQAASENQSAARSRIMDADFASETANQTRASILQQAGVAMLQQANQVPNQVLKLLQG